MCAAAPIFTNFAIINGLCFDTFISSDMPITTPNVFSLCFQNTLSPSFPIPPSLTAFTSHGNIAPKLTASLFISLLYAFFFMFVSVIILMLPNMSFSSMSCSKPLSYSLKVSLLLALPISYLLCGSSFNLSFFLAPSLIFHANLSTASFPSSSIALAVGYI